MFPDMFWTVSTVTTDVFHSNPEYKDTPMDIAQLPHPPEKTSESSESSDSESESKDNSGRTGSSK